MLLISTQLGETKHAQLCTFKVNEYVCASAPRHFVGKLKLPATACLFRDCKSCVQSISTYIVTDTHELIKPERFIWRSMGRKWAKQNKLHSTNVAIQPRIVTVRIINVPEIKNFAKFSNATRRHQCVIVLCWNNPQNLYM